MKKISMMALAIVVGAGLIGCASDKAAEAPAKPEMPAPKPAAVKAEPAAAVPTSYALVMPVNKGKTDAWKAHRAAIEGERKDANNEGLKTGKIEKEVFFLMATPMGDMGIGYFEGEGATTVMSSFMKSETEHAKLSQKELGEIFPMPGPDAPPMPTNEQKIDVKTTVADANELYSFAAPITDQAAWDAFAAALNGDKKDAYVKSLEERGISREQVWLQAGPKGNIAVVVWNIKDPKNAMNLGDSEFGKWFKEQLAAVHGMDMKAPPPPPTEKIGYFEVH